MCLNWSPATNAHSRASDRGEKGLWWAATARLVSWATRSALMWAAAVAPAAAWSGALAYTLQLYFDFSGYSDIALGTAHMLGYKLAQNFDMPYHPGAEKFYKEAGLLKK